MLVLVIKKNEKNFSVVFKFAESTPLKTANTTFFNFKEDKFYW